MSNDILIGRGPGRPVIVREDTTFDAVIRSGMMLAAEGVNPDGNASGTTLTVTVTGAPFGDTADGAAVGETLTVTTSLSPAGSAEAIHFAPGDTITVTTSVSTSGLVTTAAVDGGAIYEFSTQPVQSELYREVSYDSIYGRGDRIENGLLQAGEYGWSFVFGLGASGFNDQYGADGPAASGTTPGASFWFSTVEGEGLDIRGFTLIGEDEIDSFENFWSFFGGLAPGVLALEPYFSHIQGHNPNQLTLTTGYVRDYYYTIYEDDPKYYIPYSHYEFVYVDGARPDVRWTNEIWLKIAHSNLDGGDRRPGSAIPTKTVTFTYSSEWGWSPTDSLHDTPQQALFDGRLYFESTKKQATPGQAANVSNAVTATGAYFGFQFPRPVVPKHLCFINYNDAVESYVGDTPQHYGTWHWEYSLNSGGSWTSVGGTWSFRDGCVHMIAPREPNFALPPVGTDGEGATHWRMVLDSGPAFGSGRGIMQIMFDLDDVTDLAPPFTVDFTDDTDATPVTPTIGAPGSAYIVRFSDGTDDALNFTVLNIPNPVLTIAFTDDGQFDTWSDLYPSMVVQTIVIAKGR